MEEALRGAHRNPGPHLAYLTFMVGLCSNRMLIFFKLIYNSRTKHDCWLNPRLTMEREVLEFDDNYNVDPSQYDITVSKIMRLKDYDF